MTLTNISCDWHIHTRHSSCGHSEATLARVAAGVEAEGITAYGFADQHFGNAARRLLLQRELYALIGEITRFISQ